jgi:hypothetical protein
VVTLLRVLFAGVLIAMVTLTIAASLEQGIVEAAGVLWPDAWFRATLADAYFGFLTVYVWIAYRERTLSARVVWFILLMSLGTIAVALYLLLALRRLGPSDSIERLLLRTSDQETSRAHARLGVDASTAGPR